MPSQRQLGPSDVTAVAGRVLAALADAHVAASPFRYWLLEEVLPEAAGEAVTALPFEAPVIADTQGRRETHNSTRVFFSPENRRRFAVCEAIAAAFQNPRTVGALEACCGIDLGGAFLRIEYCQDAGDFWLEPHTDIGAKLFTMLVYLSRASEASGWGTALSLALALKLAQVQKSARIRSSARG